MSLKMPRKRFSCIMGEQQSFPKPWNVLGWGRGTLLRALHRCSWKSQQHTQLQAHTRTNELNHICQRSRVSASGWIGIARENSGYWHKIYSPGHTPFTTNASYFNLIRCWQVYLARRGLTKWSNSWVGVNAAALWRIRGRSMFNHVHCNTRRS